MPVAGIDVVFSTIKSEKIGPCLSIKGLICDYTSCSRERFIKYRMALARDAFGTGIENTAD